MRSLASGLLERAGLKDAYVDAVLWTRAQRTRVSERVGHEVRYRVFRRTALDRARASAELTAVITTVGESHLLDRCLASLEAQSLRPGQVEVVRDVTPHAAAFAQGLDRTRTPYLLALDDDMILDPDCVERLYCTIAAEPVCANATASLRDPLLGTVGEVHLYRTEALRAVGSLVDFQGGGEQDHATWRLDFRKYVQHCFERRGLTRRPLKIELADHHPVYLPREAYWKFRVMGERARCLGPDGADRFEALLQQLLERYQRGGEEVILYALAGLFGSLHVPEEELGGPFTYAGRDEAPGFAAVDALLRARRDG